MEILYIQIVLIPKEKVSHKIYGASNLETESYFYKIKLIFFWFNYVFSLPLS